MKKILAILAMLFSTLALVSVTTPPAQADTCGNWQFKYSTTVYEQLEDTGWGFKSRVRYRECEGGQEYYEVSHIYVTITHLNATEYCNGDFNHLIDGWTGDPNILGNWNPGAEFVTCFEGLEEREMDWYAGATPEKLYAGMSQAERCVAVPINTEWHNRGDSGVTVPAVCFNF